MTATPKSAAGGSIRQADSNTVRPPEAAGPFVLNLTSSTTPMALSNPDQPELKRFSFFVSRRFEEGRERFRLHMGYFNTLAEAEEWLGAVRDIYPGAWAGEAPGKKLRERALAAAAAQAQHAAGPPPLKPTRDVVASAPAVPMLPVADAVEAGIDLTSLNIPTIHAATDLPPLPRTPTPAVTVPKAPLVATALKAPPVAKSVPATARSSNAVAPANTPAAKPKPAVASAPVPARIPTVTQMLTATEQPAIPVAQTATAKAVKPPAVQQPAAVATPAPKATAAPLAVPSLKAAPMAPARAARYAGLDASQAAVAPTLPAAGPAQPARQNARPGTKASGLPNSNVREVLKALDERLPEPDTTGETRMMPAPKLPGPDDIAVDGENNFTDTQVLKFLEVRRADGTDMSGMEVETGAISLLKPDDTVTRRALKEAVKDNAPVWFAVQLNWSVQPVELAKVPPLAIFSAYLSYTVEGSRDGRRWYGLRLGFFSDAIAAKQVAYYVRSEFNSVAVVPVSPQERSRASDTETRADIAFAKKERAQPVEEFKLIDAGQEIPMPQPDLRRPAGRTGAPAKSAARQAVAPRQARPALARGNGRVRAREARAPQTLEETLEILGASQLEMDTGENDGTNDSGVRHLRVETQKNSKFGRLLERLSERVRKP